MAAMLYQVKPTEPVIFLLVAAMLHAGGAGGVPVSVHSRNPGPARRGHAARVAAFSGDAAGRVLAHSRGSPRPRRHSRKTDR